MRTSLLDQLDTLRKALDLASGEADYAQDIARRENPSLRSALQALDLDLWRLMRRVEALQTAQEAANLLPVGV